MTLLDERLKGGRAEETVVAVVKGWAPADEEVDALGLAAVLAARNLDQERRAAPIARELWLTAVSLQVEEDGTRAGSDVALSAIERLELHRMPHSRWRHLLVVHVRPDREIAIEGEQDELAAFADELAYRSGLPDRAPPAPSPSGVIDLVAMETAPVRVW